MKWRKKSDKLKLGHIKTVTEYEKTDNYKKYAAEKAEYEKEKAKKRRELEKKTSATGNVELPKATNKRKMDCKGSADSLPAKKKVKVKKNAKKAASKKAASKKKASPK